MAVTQRKKRLKDPYKLVLLREETLQEVGSYRLTLLNVYILVSVVLLITAAIAIALIFFTPIKRLIPGYADPENSREYVTLLNHLDTLEQQIEVQQLYIERFSALVSHVPGDTASSGSSATRLPDFEIIPQEQPGAVRYTNNPSSYNGSVSAESPLALMFFMSPLKGRISAEYDYEAGHYGIDVLAPKSTPVKAIMDGHIITSDWTLETGNTIGIQHANNIVSFYKHNARNLKQLGEFVKAGEAVAIIGNTGEISSGPHLHFELWVDGQPVDPSEYIDFNQ